MAISYVFLSKVLGITKFCCSMEQSIEPLERSKRASQSRRARAGDLAGEFAEVLAGCLGGWLVGWLVGWLAGWLAGWLVGWLVGEFAGELPAPPRRDLSSNPDFWQMLFCIIKLTDDGA